MLFQIKSYLKFLLKSTNQHGVHSPFVYQLITECFYDTSDKKWYQKLEHYRNTLLKNDVIIEIEDFGAGSKSLQQRKRKISDIAKNAGITYKRAKLLGRMVSYFEAKNILEIGTSIGISTTAMSFGSPNGLITTLEGCPNTTKFAKDSFEKFELNNINSIVGNFDKTLSYELQNKIFDFIYFDGNHQKQATINYFEQCLPHIHNQSVFIFDDIYWSRGMQEAWQYIKNHPKVTVSIDTFYWGIVFFRKEQEKEHFVIRI
ncbi:class I SAM-dependent methyltransferase [Aureibaculum sp. 2210JD6-5]|uniref:O-methyltransferase n=1 Tax=Aureibaculum sp. 2210JD6-5 TaxID=3103957 RepID=UPI002AAD17A5|nr:class I SAM-dependent methyltransferase [Aureibaculum sp. 2210JD6-5]MDY7394214.1 class I SAM-dependent methyltransferase [Aureibaculum sp. 2210JD6-5]